MRAKPISNEIRVLANRRRIEIRLAGRLIGWLSYCVRNTSLHIEDLLIDDGADFKISSMEEKRRSQRRRGYGSTLIEAAVEMARRHGLTSIVGVVNADDLAATPGLISWYRRRGFEAAVHPDGFLIRKML